MLESPSEGRFQTRHIFTTPTAQDLKGSTADLLLFPVSHDYIQVLFFGYHVMAAPGAMSTAGVIQVWKQIKDNGALAIANALATLSFDNTKAIYGGARVELNAGASTIPSTRNYPLANRHDVLVIKLTTQGVGAGAQSVRPFIVYREMPAASQQG
jgi:hypothetical protein